MKLSNKFSQLVKLSPVSMVKYRGNIGQNLKEGAAVRAIHMVSGKPMPRVKIRFYVVEGKILLNGRHKSVEVLTNREGIAKTDLLLKQKGYALVGAELINNPDQSVFFYGYTNGMTDQLYLYTDPCIQSSAGEISVRISAIDLNGKPVKDAKLTIEGYNARLDMPLEGKVKKVGRGEYTGIIKTHAAGNFTILVQDKSSYVIATIPLTVLPGKARSFEFIGVTDPRVKKPYDVVDLTVRLVDKFGNPLSPTRIRVAKKDGSQTSPVLIGDVAVFPIQSVGYTHVPVVISDSESKIKLEYTITFSATWLNDPGLVLVGERYATQLFVIPPPDRPADHGTVEIHFNPKKVRFNNFTKTTNGPKFSATTKVESNKLFINLQSRTAYAAQKFPEGIHIGEIEWECIGEGETCFALVAKMSPSTPAWELCVDQKRKLNSCICINIIYPSGNTAARDAGIQAANQVPTIVSSGVNVARCCPVLAVGINTCPLSQAEINTRTGGDGIVNSLAEWRTLTASSSCTKDNCINVTMVPFNVPSGEKGWTDVGMPGNSALDPTTATTLANAGAHEISHALGLNHASAGGAANNLMHPNAPGTDITADQCKTIFQTIGNYPCS